MPAGHQPAAAQTPAAGSGQPPAGASVTDGVTVSGNPSTAAAVDDDETVSAAQQVRRADHAPDALAVRVEHLHQCCAVPVWYLTHAQSIW